MNSSTSSSDLKAFSRRIVVYGIVFLSGLVAACFFLPSKRARETMLVAQVAKLKALEALAGERIIIVGGSGCGQGLVTSNICVALNRPAYNMGLHAGLGLIYQMSAVEPQIRKGDVVLLIPEYAQFSADYCFGNVELLMMVMDIMPEHKKLLSATQWLHLVPLMPKYGADKLRVAFTMLRGAKVLREYDAFGDAIFPAGVRPDVSLTFKPSRLNLKNSCSENVIRHILDFARIVKGRGAAIYVLPPAFQKLSFELSNDAIKKIVARLEETECPFIALPERYALDNAFFYDTPYHLNLNGRIFRTSLLIEDISREATRRNAPVERTDLSINEG